MMLMFHMIASKEQQCPQVSAVMHHYVSFYETVLFSDKCICM